MTGPGNSSNRIARGEDWIARELADIKRRLRRVTSTVVTSGNVVTGSQTDATQTSIASTIAGAGSSSTLASGAIAIGDASARSADDIAIGDGAQTTATSGGNAIAIGNSAETQDDNCIAIGAGATATIASSVAIGNGAAATNYNSNAIGVGSEASGDAAAAVGYGATAAGDNSVAIGLGTLADADGSIAIGCDSTGGLPAHAISDNEVCIGTSDHFYTLRGIFRGLRRSIATKTSAYTISDADDTILANGSFTLTLPDAVGREGRLFTAKNIGGGSITVSALGTSSYAPAILADSPLVYLKMDEGSGSTAFDASGNSHDFAINGSPALSQPTVMPSGVSSITLNATSKYVWKSGSGAGWMNTSSFTAEAWFNVTGTSSYHAIVSRDSSGTRGWQFFVKDGNIHIDNGTTGHSGSTTVSTGTAYHAAVVYDSGTTTTKVYLNGALDGTFSSFALNNTTGNYDLFVGVSHAGTSGSLFFPLTGDADEFAFYGSALSATQISNHYTAAIGTATIDGATTKTLPTQYDKATFQSDGTQWWIVS